MITVVVMLCFIVWRSWARGVRCGGDEVMMIGDNGGGHILFQCGEVQQGLAVMVVTIDDDW